MKGARFFRRTSAPNTKTASGGGNPDTGRGRSLVGAWVTLVATAIETKGVLQGAHNYLAAFQGEGEPTMSSREIAELTSKRHDNIMVDVRKMLLELHGEGGLLSFQDTLRNEQNGQRYTIYRLPKRETLILVSGYSVALRARIIDRWDELERASRAADPMTLLNDPAAMRGLLLNYSEKVLALQAVNDELAPKAEALDRIATADGSLCVTDAAKALQMQPKALFSYLKAHGWIFSRMGAQGYFGYSSRLASGHLEHKVTTVERADGSEKVVTQVRVTPKGLTSLARHLSVSLLAEVH